MKIIIIALFISYALATITMTLSPDTTGCSIDATITSGADTEVFYYAIAACTTAPTGTIDVTALKTAGCSWWSIGADVGATSTKVVSVAGTLLSTEDDTTITLGNDLSATALTTCTGTLTSGSGTTTCTGVYTLTEGTSYYTLSDDDAATTLGTTAFTSMTNPCVESSESSMITMSFAALASVF